MYISSEIQLCGHPPPHLAVCPSVLYSAQVSWGNTETEQRQQKDKNKIQTSGESNNILHLHLKILFHLLPVWSEGQDVGWPAFSVTTIMSLWKHHFTTHTKDPSVCTVHMVPNTHTLTHKKTQTKWKNQRVMAKCSVSGQRQQRGWSALRRQLRGSKWKPPPVFKIKRGPFHETVLKGVKKQKTKKRTILVREWQKSLTQVRKTLDGAARQPAPGLSLCTDIYQPASAVLCEEMWQRGTRFLHLSLLRTLMICFVQNGQKKKKRKKDTKQILPSLWVKWSKQRGWWKRSWIATATIIIRSE